MSKLLARKVSTTDCMYVHVRGEKQTTNVIKTNSGFGLTITGKHVDQYQPHPFDPTTHCLSTLPCFQKWRSRHLSGVPLPWEFRCLVSRNGIFALTAKYACLRMRVL